MKLSPALTMLALASGTVTIGAEIDALTGLPKNPGWELVRTNCIACHSSKLITQQRGDAERWLDVIRRMQATQNLWEFEPDVERQIIDYLAMSFPPSSDSRREGLPPQLMPPNPFAPDDDGSSESP